ncbi:hypothetical protein NA57DRAFT_78908 [Rhizodiscina lignyota]|uniref:ABM domain-containing protein n=1 Tax=Rhizodiscina lignyota TaxID=1504668 RepID=A0A9P4ICQ9_9PEZI|nr:hypothetical protein NA57DRAFT_78908 [Rhizodiscina lignyota]
MSSISNTVGTPAGKPMQSTDYAFTEITSFEFTRQVSIEDDTTPACQLWAKTVEAYISHAGTTILAWGRVVESPQVIKLVVDWKSLESRKDFTSSRELVKLRSQWHCGSTPFQSRTTSLFALPSYAPTRRNVFALPSRFSERCVSVLLTFRFSPSYDPSAIDENDEASTAPRTKQIVFENLWAALSRAALQSDGGVISSSGAQGWYVEENENDKGQTKSFIGIFRFKDLESAHTFFDPQRNRDTHDEGVIGKMRGIADAGFEIEYVRMIGEKGSEPPFEARSNPFVGGGKLF